MMQPNPNTVIRIRRVYSVVPVDDKIVAVDFLRDDGLAEYRMLKYFFREDWDEIAEGMRYRLSQEFCRDDTTGEVTSFERG